jgi:hypothetical protein
MCATGSKRDCGKRKKDKKLNGKWQKMEYAFPVSINKISIQKRKRESGYYLEIIESK